MKALNDKIVLVVGGGVAGLQTSLQLATLGVKVLLVEKEPMLGGHANLLSKDSLTGDSIKEWVGTKIRAVAGNPNIQVATETKVTKSFHDGSRFKVGLRQKTDETEVEADAVVVATGFNVFDASRMPQYGYGRYKDVINNLEFERFLDQAGLTSGEIMKPSDGRKPRSVVFLTCIGSRDVKYNANCCRVGCPVALKQALMVKQKYGEDIAVYVCYIDMRAVGRGVEEFYRKAQEAGVLFIQGQPSEVRPSEDRFLEVKLFDSSTGKLLSVNADLIVLVTGLSPNVDLASTLGLEVAEDGFYVVEHPKFETSTTKAKGIFLAGTAEGPKDIAEALDHASQTALKVAEFLLSV